MYQWEIHCVKSGLSDAGKSLQSFALSSFLLLLFLAEFSALRRPTLCNQVKLRVHTSGLDLCHCDCKIKKRQENKLVLPWQQTDTNKRLNKQFNLKTIFILKSPHCCKRTPSSVCVCVELSVTHTLIYNEPAVKWSGSKKHTLTGRFHGLFNPERPEAVWLSGFV